MTADGARAESIALSDLFVNAARVFPTRPALCVDGCTISYAELRSTADRLAAAIAGAMAPSEGLSQQCGLLVGRSLSGYASVLGALSAGYAYVPLNPRFPAARLLAILQASDVETIVVDRLSMAAAKPVVLESPRPLAVLMPDAASPPDWAARAHRHHFMCRQEIEKREPTSLQARRSGDDGAYLLFTSGSTGVPKGVLIRHGNVMAYLRAVTSRYGPTPEDRFSQLFDFSFDLSAHDMFLCWSVGACLYSPPHGAVAVPRDFVQKHELTFWFSVPSAAAMMTRLRMLDPGCFPSLRVSLFCGEALPARLAQSWRRAAPNSLIENLYGPTEATIAVTAYSLPDNEREALRYPVVPIGSPFPGQEAVVIDEDGKPVPDGEPGELCVGGSQVASGYWRSPETSAKRFSPPVGFSQSGQRWYRTGDRVLKDAKRGLIFLGRVDRQVKIRGHRIDLQEVESVVREVADGASVAALPWPSDGTDLARHIVVFIAGEDRSAGSIIAHCRNKLPPVAVPRQVNFLSHWPLNANGKTDYTALKQQMTSEPC